MTKDELYNLVSYFIPLIFIHSFGLLLMHVKIYSIHLTDFLKLWKKINVCDSDKEEQLPSLKSFRHSLIEIWKKP